MRFTCIITVLFLGWVAPAQAGERMALVIGNAAYQQNPLANPVNDAIAIAAKLREFDFKVVEALNADLPEMQSALLDFVDIIEPGATALVFYAGHGIQANGRNYLMPVDAGFSDERTLRFEALAMDAILDELERAGARMNIVVLDACRNNPFERKFRGGSRGLAVVDAAQGTLIAYATAPGSVAADGEGQHGLYTQALLDALEYPGLKVEDVFKQVRRTVARASDNRQMPWESSSLLGDFVFNTQTVEGASTTLSKATPASGIPAAPTKHLMTTPTRSCDDLSGRWYANLQDDPDPACRDTFNVRAAEDGDYNIDYAMCGPLGAVTNIRGTGTFEDQILRFKWRSMPCNGTTEYRLNASCRSGTGQVVERGGLPGVCSTLVSKTTIVDVQREL